MTQKQKIKNNMTLGRAIYLIKSICSNIKVSDVMESHAYATMIIKDLKEIIDKIDIPELVGRADGESKENSIQA